MPNFSFNVFAIKGKTSDVLQVINDAIENSVRFRGEYGTAIVVEPKNNIHDAFDTLMEVGCSLISDINFRDETGQADPIVDDKIRLSTFRPIPIDILKYDTTNYPDKFPEIVKEQQETYGCSGWYDLNRNVFFGTKWNSELYDFNLHVSDDGIATIYFSGDTAWSQPMLWLEWLKEKYPNVAFFICSNEESGMFYCYGEVGGEEYDLTESIEEQIQEAMSEYEDDFELQVETEENAIEELRGEFYSYVSGYKVGEC